MRWPFGAAADRAAAQRLLATATLAARQRGFFGPGRVADTMGGRTELVFLHAALALIRLKEEETARQLAQAFVDRLFRNLDEGLREAGIGDLSVPRRMRKLAQAFYGRLNAYAAAIREKDRKKLAEAFARNIFNAALDQAPFAIFLADYAMETAAVLSLAPIETLERGEVWRTAARQ